MQTLMTVFFPHHGQDWRQMIVRLLLLLVCRAKSHPMVGWIYQLPVPGSPLYGPTISEVTQPP